MRPDPIVAQTHIIPSFLGDDLRARLLDYAIRSEALLSLSQVGPDEGRFDSNMRVSRRTAELGDIAPQLRDRISARLPELTEALGIKLFEIAHVELELVAHGDGAFYRRHIDTATGRDFGQMGHRIISCVYYFHREPKGFSCGELRLYPLPTAATRGVTHIDVEPRQDSLVAFSSWLPHEVMPVSCASGEFADSRFAINCWLYQAAA